MFCEGDQDKFQGQRLEFRKLIENGKLSHNEISDENQLGTLIKHSNKILVHYFFNKTYNNSIISRIFARFADLHPQQFEN